jgi:hypothetical protein
MSSCTDGVSLLRDMIRGWDNRAAESLTTVSHDLGKPIVKAHDLYMAAKGLGQARDKDAPNNAM